MGGDDGANGRVERFRIIYDAAYDDVWAYCRRRAPAAAAEDAAAETFTVAWRRLDDVPPPPGARPWLFGVARRVLANQRRGDQRRQRLHLRLVHDSSRRVAATPADQGVGLSTVMEALGTLSDDDQELLRLVAWEGLDNAEVAVVLSCSAGNVAVRLHRARKRLAKALRAGGVSAADDSSGKLSAEMKSMDGDGQVGGRRATPADTTVGKEEDR